jgi:DNA-directed RNA polymerase specialized sigma24 family protein
MTAMSAAPSSGLTQQTFEALLRLLDPDRERAGALYEKIRRRVVRLFEWRGAPDAVDLADEVINRVARRVGDGLEVKARDPYVYFSGVAHLVLLEVSRRAHQPVTLRDGEAPVEEPGSDETERSACVERCLAAMPPDQRRMLLQYYQGSHNVRHRQQLSRDLGMTPSNLRVKVHRLRCKIKDCVEKCLRKAPR